MCRWLERAEQMDDPMKIMVVAEAWDGSDVSPTLTASNCGGSQRMPDKGNFTAIIAYPKEKDEMQNAVVRRLTPLECERLQGYPDGYTDIGEWTDSKGKKHKEADSPRYKALGNSIALPYWEWLAKKVATSLGDSDLTMGSLFSGIGGFELVFQRAGVRPIWASEVEEFCIAVTKLHFPENEDAKKE